MGISGPVAEVDCAGVPGPVWGQSFMARSVVAGSYVETCSSAQPHRFRPKTGVNTRHLCRVLGSFGCSALVRQRFWGALRWCLCWCNSLPFQGSVAGLAGFFAKTTGWHAGCIAKSRNADGLRFPANERLPCRAENVCHLMLFCHMVPFFRCF